MEAREQTSALGPKLTEFGAFFSIEAAEGERVRVIGDFNSWTPWRNVLERDGAVWRGFVEGARKGSLYKFRIEWLTGGESDIADPRAVLSEGPPHYASILWPEPLPMARQARDDRPAAILNVDIERAHSCIDAAERMGFTHVRVAGAHAGGLAMDRRAGSPDEVQRLVREYESRGLSLILEGPEAWTDIYGAARTRVAVNGDWAARVTRYLRQDPLYRAYVHDIAAGAIEAAAADPESAIGAPEPLEALESGYAGDQWQKPATTRLWLGLLYGSPGVKLVGDPGPHALLTGSLNHLMRVHGLARDAAFAWLGTADASFSVYSFARGENLLVVANCTPVPRPNYRIGVRRKGRWCEALNSDAREYGGSGHGNLGRVDTAPIGFGGEPYSLTLTLPPLSVLFLAHEG